VSAFRLDQYEVTVARFRAFVKAYDQWHVIEGNPKVGSGAHPRIGGSGWNRDWQLPANQSELVASLQSTNGTWAASGNETLPINYVDWYTAFAFCYWDGGRLPTEAEWEFAAGGGAAKHVYPWGDSPVLTDLQDSTGAYATYNCLGDGSTGADCSFADVLQVGSKPAGRGTWGHLDLAGSIAEWTLDTLAAYPATPATNYANLDPDIRVYRGGNWKLAGEFASAAKRWGWAPELRDEGNGLRCARSP
jgi:formylglycine-generating enzyme required for sulfatase activity